MGEFDPFNFQLKIYCPFCSSYNYPIHGHILLSSLEDSPKGTQDNPLQTENVLGGYFLHEPFCIKRIEKPFSAEKFSAVIGYLNFSYKNDQLKLYLNCNYIFSYLQTVKLLRKNCPFFFTKMEFNERKEVILSNLTDFEAENISFFGDDDLCKDAYGKAVDQFIFWIIWVVFISLTLLIIFAHFCPRKQKSCDTTIERFAIMKKSLMNFLWFLSKILNLVCASWLMRSPDSRASIEEKLDHLRGRDQSPLI